MATGPVDGCLACETVAGRVPVPGGLIADGGLWVADHCLGPFGVGALIAKTRAHRPALWTLSPEEQAAMGPFLAAVTGAMVEALDAERVYVFMWVDDPPHHVHLALEPQLRSDAGSGGARRRIPEPAAAAAAAERVRAVIAERHPQYLPAP